MAETSALFSPARVGNVALSHRIVMAPMTRRRAASNFVPTPLMAEYYAQRASVPGTLIISEATAVSPRAASLPNTPGLWNQEQVEGWRAVTDAVHGNGSFIYVQLWMCGRAARPGAVRQGAEVISSGDVPIGAESPKPRSITEGEIRECIQEFSEAARNAFSAGFDGVELHGANGYLLDQFTQDVSNNRHDGWGGSVENRSRFPISVAKAVAEAIGSERVGYRTSPWSRHHGMRMDDPVPQFTHLVRQLKELHLGYLHIIESRVQGPLDVPFQESIGFVADIWGETSPIIFAGGYNADTSRARVDDEKAKGREALVAFGRTFVSNPDLPIRVKEMLPITKYDRDLFYQVGYEKGYIDYPLWKEEKDEVLREGRKHVWPTGLAGAILQ